MPSFTSTNSEFRNNRQRQSKNKKLISTMTDDDQAAEITLLDAAGAVTAISDNETPKTVDDVWREIVAGRREMRECKKEAPDEMMTLEDFLAKAEAMEEEVKAERLGFDLMPVSLFPFEERGKKRAVLEPLDKVAQQRQKRMIKNRESAARSRERKQAYQVELESLAVKLEEENEKLLKEKAEQTRERFKQLMEKVVPFVEKQRPPRVIRRVHSMHW